MIAGGHRSNDWTKIVSHVLIGDYLNEIAPTMNVKDRKVCHAQHSAMCCQDHSRRSNVLSPKSPPPLLPLNVLIGTTLIIDLSKIFLLPVLML